MADGGHPLIAAEISSVWRSMCAREEDAYFGPWSNEVQGQGGRVSGRFCVSVRLCLPDGLSAQSFTKGLVALIGRRATGLGRLKRHGKAVSDTVA